MPLSLDNLIHRRVYRRFLEAIAAVISTIGVVNRVQGKQDSWSPYGQGLKDMNSNLDLISESLNRFYKHSSTFTTKENIPGWWIWFYYINPVTWTLRGIITSQLSNVESHIIGPGFDGSVKEFLKVSLGYDSGMTGVSAVVLAGFFLFFFAIYATTVKVLNFWRR